MKFLGQSTTFDYLIDRPSIAPSTNEEGAISLVFLDGSKELIDLKSRRSMSSKFVVTSMTQDQFNSLFDYLLDNTGKDIQILAAPNELVFGPAWSEANQTINIKEVRPRGLSDFSYDMEIAPGREIGGWELEIEAVLIKNGDEDLTIPGEYEFVVEIETKTFSYDLYLTDFLPNPYALTTGTTAMLEADNMGYVIVEKSGGAKVWEPLPPFSEGEIPFWFKTESEFDDFMRDVSSSASVYLGLSDKNVPCYVEETNQFYEVKIDKLNRVEDINDTAGLHTTSVEIKVELETTDKYFAVPKFKRVVANLPSLNYRGGKFFFSSFADIDTSLIDGMDQSSAVDYNRPSKYLTGFIAEKGISFPSEDADMIDGPSIQNLSDFDVALNNAKRLHWTTLGFNLLGAKVSLFILKRQPNGRYTKHLVSSGYNKTNSVDFSNYSFQVETELFNTRNNTLPKKTWNDVVNLWYGENSTEAKEAISTGSTLLPMTYGKHKYAQAIPVQQTDEDFVAYYGPDANVVNKQIPSWRISDVTYVSDYGDDEIYRIDAIPQVASIVSLLQGLTIQQISDYLKSLHINEATFLNFDGTDADIYGLLHKVSQNSYTNSVNSLTHRAYFFVRKSTIPFESINDLIGIGFSLHKREYIYCFDNAEVLGTDGSQYVQAYLNVDENTYTALQEDMFKKTGYGHGFFKINHYNENLVFTSPTDVIASGVEAASWNQSSRFPTDETPKGIPRLSENKLYSAPIYQDGSFPRVDAQYFGQNLTASHQMWLANGYVKIPIPNYITRPAMSWYNASTQSPLYNGMYLAPLKYGPFDSSVPSSVAAALAQTASTHFMAGNLSGYYSSLKKTQDVDNFWALDATTQIRGRWYEIPGGYTDTAEKFVGIVPTLLIKNIGLSIPESIASGFTPEELQDFLLEIPYIQLKSTPVLDCTFSGTNNNTVSTKQYLSSGATQYYQTDFIKNWRDSSGTPLQEIMQFSNGVGSFSGSPTALSMVAPGSPLINTSMKVAQLGVVAQNGWWWGGYDQTGMKDRNWYAYDYPYQKARESIFWVAPHPIQVTTTGGVPHYRGNGYGPVDSPPEYPNGFAFTGIGEVEIYGTHHHTRPGMLRSVIPYGGFDVYDRPLRDDYDYPANIFSGAQNIFAEGVRIFTPSSSFGINGNGCATDPERLCAVLPFSFDKEILKEFRGKQDVRIHTSIQLHGNISEAYVQVFLKKKGTTARLPVGREYLWNPFAEGNFYPEDMSFQLKQEDYSLVRNAGSLDKTASFTLTEAEQTEFSRRLYLNNMPSKFGGASSLFNWGGSKRAGVDGSSLWDIPYVVPHGKVGSVKKCRMITAGRELFEALPDSLFQVRADGTCELEDYDGLYFVIKPVFKPLSIVYSSTTVYRTAGTNSNYATNFPAVSMFEAVFGVSNDLGSRTPMALALSYKQELSLEDDVFVEVVGRIHSEPGTTDTWQNLDTAYEVAKNAYRQFKPQKAVLPPLIPDPTEQTTPLNRFYNNSASYTRSAFLGNDPGYNEHWPIRTQIMDGQNIADILSQAAKHSFCTIAINAQQELLFKPLNYKDYPVESVACTFDESTIIKEDSIKTSFRDVDKIYRKYLFRLQDGKEVRVYLDNASTDPSLRITTNFDNDWVSNTINLFKASLEEMFLFSKRLWDVNNENELEVDLDWCYFDSNDAASVQSIFGLVRRFCEFFCFNSWTISFKTSMRFFVNEPSLNKEVKRLEVGDYVEIKSWFFTNDNPIRGFITSMKPDPYSGVLGLEVFCPAPPEAYAAFYDPVWDGKNITSNDYNTDDFKYDGIIEVYPFRNGGSAPGTFPSGPSNLSSSTSIEDFTFTDGSFASHPPL